MLRAYPRLMLALGGGAAGVGLGLTYWFAWGCRRCAAGERPIRLVAFFAIVSAAMAVRWGRDHFDAPLS
ncbi:MAG: hypothetical protein AAF928_19875 [Myxococcota bacterium]